MEIKPGTLLGTSPLVGSQKIDNEKGTAVYAVARVGTAMAPGTRCFATIIFKVRPNARGMLKIEIARVALANERFEEVRGLQTQGATIVVYPLDDVCHMVEGVTRIVVLGVPGPVRADDPAWVPLAASDSDASVPSTRHAESINEGL